jgi:hypothetical protein
MKHEWYSILAAKKKTWQGGAPTSRDGLSVETEQ